MTEGSAQEDEEGKKGPDFSAPGPGFRSPQPGQPGQGQQQQGQQQQGLPQQGLPLQGLPQRGMPQQGPTWPSQNTDEPSQSQIDTHDHLPQTGSEEADEQGRSASPGNTPTTYPQLKLPSKPKPGRPNLAVNRYPDADPQGPADPTLQYGQSTGGQPGYTYGVHSGYAPGDQPDFTRGGQPGFAHGDQPGFTHGGQPGFTHGGQPGYVHGGQPGHAHGGQPGVAGGPADAGMPGGSAPAWPGAAPAKPAWPGQQGTPLRAPQARLHSPTSHQPGQINPDFVPPTEAPVLPNAGFVPTNAGAPQHPVPPHKAPKPGAPIITSASAKPNWTQPQWPGSKPMASPQKGVFGPILARRSTGNRLPPSLSPQPEAPYSQAPPTSGNAPRGLLGGSLGQTPFGNAGDQAYGRQGAPHQGLKNSLPFTIQRDLILAKQLFGDQANRPVQKERREYKQTEYIPKAPKLKVSAPDPDRPWKAVPAATYEFFAEEDRAPANPQTGINTQTPKEPQVPRAFNPENPRVPEDLDAQPDPRYSPYQGELLKDISIQDKKAGYTEEPIPEETRARGTAALRALGRNSDHYYESHPGTNPQPEDLPKSVRLTSRDLFGLATYYVIVTKEVLTSPQSFFANMSLVGGLNDPLLYLAFASVMGGILAAVAKLNPLLFFLAAIFSLVSVAFEAVLLQFVLKRMGGEGKFEQTFNVLAYSKATFIFAWISLGPWPVGAILATLYTAYLNYLGLSRVHRMPAATIWTVIGILTAIGIIIKFVMK